ncbi:MAG TPA: DUF169 domain-containing protein [Candidatus Lokiarchaeia archaeon]|nr:DUF169 domain-containing protein [Candidatus Lokiarchaeia archaeon]
MTEPTNLTNAEISRLFEKYAKLKKYKPLGVYFSNNIPEGKIRLARNVFNRCIPRMAFKASAKGKPSVIGADYGCPGGLWWAGLKKYPPRGITVFLADGGRPDCFGGRGERMKKTPALGAGVIKNPGPVKLPDGTRYVVFQRLRDIPDATKIEFVLFFANTPVMANIVPLLNYSRDIPGVVRAPAGSGCMSVLNFPLLMKEEPEVDAVLGLWDWLSRRGLPKNILTLAIRRWFAQDVARDLPNSSLGHPAPFTIRGELILLWQKLRRKMQEKCQQYSKNVLGEESKRHY